MNRQELVEETAEAIWSAAGMDWRPQDFSKASKDERERCLRAADAALSVSIEELLKEPNALEFDAAINATMREMDAKYHPDGSLHQYAMCRMLLINRRAKLERVKTPEERVTIHWPSPTTAWEVWLDDANHQSFCEPKAAEIYRLGLIQQLKNSA